MLWKEFRECAVIAALASGALLLVGALLVVAAGNPGGFRVPGFGQVTSPLWRVGVLLYSISILQGAALAIRQYGVPGITGVWSGQVHLPVRRSVHLWVRMAFGAGCFLLLALGWVALFAAAASAGILPVAPQVRILFYGLLLPPLGFVVYMGTGVTCLTNAKWYEGRPLGVFSAVLILLFALFCAGVPGGAWIVLSASCALAVALHHAFLTKELRT